MNEALYHYLKMHGRAPDIELDNITLEMDVDDGALDIWYTENGHSEYLTINHVDTVENFVKYVFDFGRTYDR